MNICILMSKNSKVRMVIDREVAQDRLYMSRDLKRVDEPKRRLDPCNECLLSSVCSLWCDEKNDYLWD